MYAGLKDFKIGDIKRKHNSIDWEAYNRLIRQQDKIGWSRIKYGFFGTEWTTMQAQYHHKLHKTQKENQH